MSPPPLRSSSTMPAGLAVRALVSISLLILSQVPSAAEAAVPSGLAGTASSPWHRPSGAPTPVQGAAPSSVSATAAWDWPVGPEHAIVRPFIAPATTYSAGHRGIDVGSEEGAPVVAPADGVVHFAGVVVDRPIVSLRHGGEVISSFEPVEPVVVEGQLVARGELIGTVTAGHCASTCVHIGARSHGQYVSPLKYLGGLAPSVLLPTRAQLR